MEDAEATLLQALLGKHRAALWRYAVRLSGDQMRLGHHTCGPGVTR